MRKTKIVCTIGPACNDVETLSSMINAGMDVARLNFSHGDYESLGAIIEEFYEARERTGKQVPLVMDTKGPEIRTGNVHEPITLQSGESITFECDSDLADMEQSDGETIYLSYDGLVDDIKTGYKILIDDGRLRARVTGIDGNCIRAEVETGGTIGSRRGVNVPEAALSLPVLTSQDKEDVRFALEHDVDFVALSFVRTANNIISARDFIEDEAQIIAKVEDKQGVANASDIIKLSDGIMVARGDLGVEMSLPRVPGIQKELIEEALAKRKPVITATEMLDSMESSPTPTRAEVSDVYQAVQQGSSAVMLSGETAVGEYPVKAVEAIHDIINTAEEECNFDHLTEKVHVRNSVTTSICRAGVASREAVNAVGIVAFTETGRTARSVSSFRPETPIAAVTRNTETLRRLHLHWGVQPIHGGDERPLEALLESAERYAQQLGIAEEGDTIVCVAGTPVGRQGSTNTVRVSTVGNVIVRGFPLNGGIASGRVRFCTSFEDVTDVSDDEIAVLRTFRPEWLNSFDCPAAVLIAGTHVDKELIEHLSCPILTEVLGVDQRLDEGDMVQVLASKGVVLLQD